MAKNRKNQSAAVRFGPALKAFLLCACIGGSGIGYVWQKNQIHALGRQITERENRLAELSRQNKIRMDQLTALCSPKTLDARVKELNLGLIEPLPSQVVHLVEAPADAIAGQQNQIYTERRSLGQLSFGN